MLASLGEKLPLSPCPNASQFVSLWRLNSAHISPFFKISRARTGHNTTPHRGTMAMPYAPQVQDTSGPQYDTSLALRVKVLSLYSLDTNSDAVISEAYHRRCKFVDPLVSTTGHREVKAQFRSLRVFLRQSKAELISSHYDVASRSLTMDTTMVFKPKLWPFSSFRLRNFTVVEVDGDGLVRKHTDHWSVASLLETKLGWVYNVGRRAFGATTSLLIGWLTKDKAPRMLTGADGRPITAQEATSKSN